MCVFWVRQARYNFTYYLGAFTGVILKAWLCEASGSLAGNYVTASVGCTEACRKFAGKAGEIELLGFLEERGRLSSLQRLKKV